MKKQPAKNAPRQGNATGRVTHWGDVAEWYDGLVGEGGMEYHREVILPGIVRMLEASRREESAVLRVLDLACGQGVLCRRLASLGHEVTGVDAAQSLIEAARRRSEGERLAITYIAADATKLVSDNRIAADLPQASFDAITCILAIQNMSPLSPVWQACRLLLKPTGSLILVMMHPAFRIPKQSDWQWNDPSHAQGRIVYQYLSSAKIAIQTHPGLAAHGKSAAATTHFHRPLQAYINTLGSAGLLIDHVEEWISHKTSQAGPKKEALDRARKEIPMFLALRARRVG
jgi:2-polyprenyl-3-methyl-5-hydroxy-6-metoxy-1,4-benzoquinol methylase